MSSLLFPVRLIQYSANRACTTNDTLKEAMDKFLTASSSVPNTISAGINIKRIVAIDRPMENARIIHSRCAAICLLRIHTKPLTSDTTKYTPKMEITICSTNPENGINKPIKMAVSPMTNAMLVSVRPGIAKALGNYTNIWLKSPIHRYLSPA